MNKISSILTKAGFAALSAVAFASTAMAASYDYTYDATSGSADALGAGMGIVMILVWLCMCIIGVVFFVFWLRSLLDVFKRTEAELPNKTMWIILHFFVSISFLFYWFGPRKELEAKTKKVVA